MFASTLSFGCPNGLGWKDFSSISISSKNSSSLSLTLFTDASYVKIEDGSRTKEMYQLKDGPVLFRGVTPSELTKVSPFLMLDIPIGVVLIVLSHQF